MAWPTPRRRTTHSSSSRFPGKLSIVSPTRIVITPHDPGQAQRPVASRPAGGGWLAMDEVVGPHARHDQWDHDQAAEEQQNREREHPARQELVLAEPVDPAHGSARLPQAGSSTPQRSHSSKTSKTSGTPSGIAVSPVGSASSRAGNSPRPRVGFPTQDLLGPNSPASDPRKKRRILRAGPGERLPGRADGTVHAFCVMLLSRRKARRDRWREEP
jgi:hypothetical protein